MVPVQDDLVRQAELRGTCARARTEARCARRRPIFLAWACATRAYRNPHAFRLQARRLAGLPRSAQHLGAATGLLRGPGRWRVVQLRHPVRAAVLVAPAPDRARLLLPAALPFRVQALVRSRRDRRELALQLPPAS